MKNQFLFVKKIFFKEKIEFLNQKSLAFLSLSVCLFFSPDLYIFRHTTRENNNALKKEKLKTPSVLLEIKLLNERNERTD